MQQCSATTPGLPGCNKRHEATKLPIRCSHRMLQILTENGRALKYYLLQIKELVKIVSINQSLHNTRQRGSEQTRAPSYLIGRKWKHFKSVFGRPTFLLSVVES